MHRGVPPQPDKLEIASNTSTNAPANRQRHTTLIHVLPLYRCLPSLPPGEGSALVLKRCTGHRRLLISLEQAGVQNSRAGLLLDPKGVAMTVNPVRHPDSVNGAGLHHKFL